VAQDFAGPTAQPSRADEDSEFTKDARRTWARLLAKIFEVDSMLCSCGAEMKIVSVITDGRVVARILRHLESERCKARDLFEPRAPHFPINSPTSPMRDAAVASHPARLKRASSQFRILPDDAIFHSLFHSLA